MSYQVIARKWRPQTFSDVVGQRHVTQTLQNAIKTGRVAHAYIFSGVRGVGKTTTARILAKALNCVKGPTAEPCNECDSCREITNGNSLDVLEIDAASNRGIDQIRDLREMVRYAAAGGRYKVVILDEAHQLTDEASNALLKTLEEPPDKVVFILATTQSEDLADTIKSRAQLFQFRALSFGEIVDALAGIVEQEKLKIDSGALAVLARAAEGSLRDALSLLEQAIAYCGDEITDTAVRELLGVVAESVLDELVEAIRTQSSQRALSLVHRLIADGQNLQHFCREAIRHFRNLLVARVCGADSDLVAAPKDERARLAEQASYFNEEELTRFFQILMWTDDDLRRKPDPRLHLELGLLKLVTAQRLVPLEEVLSELRGGGAPKAAAAPSRSAGAPAFSPNSTPQRFSSVPASPISTAPLVQSASRPFAAPTSTAAATAPAPISDAVTPVVAEAFSATPAFGTPSSQFAPAAPKATPAAAPLSPSADSLSSARSAPVRSSAFPISSASSTSAAAPNASQESSNVLAPEQVEAVRSALQSQKFLWSMVEHVTRWEFEGNEMRLCFPSDKGALAEMLKSRDPMERLRTVLSQVMGQPLRVCVKLDSSRAAVVDRGSELKSRFEEDPMVRAMLERFGGQISDVKRRSEE